MIVCAFPFILLALPVFDTMALGTGVYTSGMTGLEVFQYVSALSDHNALNAESVVFILVYTTWMFSSVSLLLHSIVGLFSKLEYFQSAIDVFTLANYVLYFALALVYIFFVRNFVTEALTVKYSIAMAVGIAVMPILSASSLRKTSKFRVAPIMLLFIAHVILVIALFM